MNIGIDATCWQNQRGFGRFTRELLTALFAIESQHRFVLFLDRAPDQVMQWPHVECVQVNPQRPVTEAAVAGDRRGLDDIMMFYREVSRRALDVMFFPAVYSWFPVPRKLPTMVTLHDAIPELFPKMVFPDRKSRWFWTLKVKLAIWQCKRVMTVSRAAKKQISDHIGVDPSRIDVISEAPGKAFSKNLDAERAQQFRLKIGLPDSARFIVYVGGMAPHKNLHRFLDGFSMARSHKEIDDLHLLLVGDFKGAGFHSNALGLQKRVKADDNLSTRVHFPGFLSDDELCVAYSEAIALAMPSLSEGFGLPAVEAMACGTPVLSSDQGSLPEVIGDAGVYFNPYDVEAISRAINEMSGNEALRREKAECAVARAETFSWDRSARLALDFLESLGAGDG